MTVDNDEMQRAVRTVTVVGWMALSGALAVAGATFGMGGFTEPSVQYLFLVPLPFLIAGSWLLYRQPNHRIGWLLVGGTVGAMAFSALLEQVFRAHLASATPLPEWLRHTLAFEGLISTVGLACLALLIALFPTGRVRVRREEILARLVWWLPAPALLGTLANRRLSLDPIIYGDLALENPYHVPLLAPIGPATRHMRYLLASVLLVALGMLVLRYREAGVAERRQIRWVLFGATTAIAVGALPFIVAPVLGNAGHNSLLFVSTAAMLLIPASVVIAVIEPRWIDTDAVIRKSVTYGALTFGIFLAYAGVAAGLGLAAEARLPVEIAILLTAVIAIGFQPTRTRLQLVADRLVFGARPTAIEAVAGFEEAVRTAQDPDEIAQQLAELVRTAARLHWVGVTIPPAAPTLAGRRAGDSSATVPILRDGEVYGEIACGPRIAGPFGDREAELVRALAGQAGLMLANLRLAGRLVHAQETERRRIERDIHDGAQQELVALVAKLGLARSQVRHGELDENTLVELQDDARAILRDLREFAQGIHPSVLSDGGLVEAVRDRCDRLPLEVRLDTNISKARFADDIEGAGYFFVAETVTNVLKHAEARRVTISIFLTDGSLEIRVADNGQGFRAGSTRRTGLAGLADRFEALGGSVSVDSRPASGTTVTGRLPLDRAVTK